MNADDDILARRLAVTLAQAATALPGPPDGALGAVRRRFDRRRRRLRLATAAAMACVALATAATVAGPYLGLRPSPAAPPDGAIDLWTLDVAERNPGLRDRIDAYDRDSGVGVRLSTFGNDAYKTVLAAPWPDPAPDVYENWGGASLAGPVRAGRAADLTDAVAERPEVAGALLPGVLAGARVDGRLYGLPMTGVQPVVLFYHKKLFADAGLSPPRTYADLLRAVDVFRDRGVTPLALAGGERWPALMYLAYLTDRLGGADVSAAVAAGRPGAWRQPALARAAALCQELVRHGAFGDTADVLRYDSGDASRSLADGRAAMQVMGSWEYGSQLHSDPAFAARDLGWVPFPTVAGGAGDAADLVGVPANYLTVDARSPYRAEAVDFLLRTVTSDRYLDGLLEAGEVPAVRDLEPRLAGRPHADFARFAHGLAAAAPSFTLVWDQALPPAVAGELLDRTAQLFRLEITPEAFVAAMAATG
ncbi:sugar-binding protein [Amorphoplanes nipponensis]|uniref:Sugar-binding protein n=1 Tax=Actinoplanes nipponensis TaxID=135950 RepID=A0A919JH56_9ACTN|nr:extracellular solute-binding protein [Actinoplanes nipponensis]GIE50683.1 sugar-binding protein [Actinoplanes nipponensis]